MGRRKFEEITLKHWIATSPRYLVANNYAGVPSPTLDAVKAGGYRRFRGRAHVAHLDQEYPCSGGIAPKVVEVDERSGPYLLDRGG